MSDREEPGGGSATRHRTPEKKTRGTSALEWAIAALGALIVIGAGAVLLHEGLGEPSSPPRLEAIVDSVVATAGGQLVLVRVHNHGQQTAAAVMIEGELTRGGESFEKAQATIGYVPAESSRPAGLLFKNELSAYTLHVRPIGFDLP